MDTDSEPMDIDTSQFVPPTPQNIRNTDNNINSSPPQSQKSGKSGAKIVKVIRPNGYQSPSSNNVPRGRLFDGSNDVLPSNESNNFIYQQQQQQQQQSNGDDYNPFQSRKMLNRTPSPTSRQPQQQPQRFVDYTSSSSSRTALQPEKLNDNDDENEAPTNDNYPETDNYYANNSNNEPIMTTATTNGCYNQQTTIDATANLINDEWETHKKRGASALQNVNISINTADYQTTAQHQHQQQLQQQPQQQSQQQSPPIKQTATTPSSLSSNVSSTTDLSTAGSSSISPNTLPPPPPQQDMMLLPNCDNANEQTKESQLNSSSSTSLSSGGNTDSDAQQHQIDNHHHHHQQMDENSVSHNVNNPDLTNVSAATNTNADSISQANELSEMMSVDDPFRTPRKTDELKQTNKPNNFITSRGGSESAVVDNNDALVDLASSSTNQHQNQAEAVIFDSIFSNDTEFETFLELLEKREDDGSVKRSPKFSEFARKSLYLQFDPIIQSRSLSPEKIRRLSVIRDKQEAIKSYLSEIVEENDENSSADQKSTNTRSNSNNRASAKFAAKSKENGTALVDIEEKGETEEHLIDQTLTTTTTNNHSTSKKASSSSSSSTNSGTTTTTTNTHLESFSSKKHDKQVKSMDSLTSSTSSFNNNSNSNLNHNLNHDELLADSNNHLDDLNSNSKESLNINNAERSSNNNNEDEEVIVEEHVIETTTTLTSSNNNLVINGGGGHSKTNGANGEGLVDLDDEATAFGLHHHNNHDDEQVKSLANKLSNSKINSNSSSTNSSSSNQRKSTGSFNSNTNGDEVNELREEKRALLERIGHLEEENQKFQTVAVEFERIFQQLIKDKDESENKLKSEILDLTKERDHLQEDVVGVERAFDDLHRRFEKLKTKVEEFKKNEDILQHAVETYKQQLEKEKQKYTALKKHAEEKIDMANSDIEKLRKSTGIENQTLKAELRKAEIKISSLELSVQQKDQENQQLTNLLEDLLSKVKPNN